MHYGADAEIGVYDAQRAVTIRDEMLQHNVAHIRYAGLDLTGWPELVLSRGEIIVEKGDCTGNPGPRLILRRAARELAKPRKRF